MQARFVGVLSMRGLGTFQWTKSRLIVDKFISNNYNQTCAQAEIIGELIGSDNINKKKEEKIFDFLIVELNFISKRRQIQRSLLKAIESFRC